MEGRLDARGTPPLKQDRLLALLAAAFLLAPMAQAAGEETPGAPCPYPLGEPALRGENVVLGGGDDPEYQILDATLVEGGNQVQGTLVESQGRMGIVQEMKVEFGMSLNDTDMIMLRWFEDERGWNGTPIWLSSIDSTQQVPDSPPGYISFHSRVSATVWRDEVWTIWEGWHSVWAPENQAVLMRGATPGWVSPVYVASNLSGELDSAKYGVLAPYGDRLMVVYVTREYGVVLDEYDLVWRFFDGQNFTGVLPLSKARDGWSEFIPVLVADGERIFAVWEAQALYSYVYELRYAVFNGTAWSEPATLIESGVQMPSSFHAASFGGKLLVAYDTNEPYTVNGKDLEIALVSLDPATGVVSAPRVVNPQPSDGDDVKPSVHAAAGKLFIGWQTVDPTYSHHEPVNDTDAVYRTFDGASFGPMVELSDADDAAVDDSPSFFEAGGSVYAYWIVGKFPPPRGYKHDYRQAVQLLERAADPFGAMASKVGLEPPGANGAVRVWVSVPAGASAFDAPPVLRTGNGSVVPLEREGERWTALLNGSALDEGALTLAVCGKSVPTARDDTLVPSQAPVTPEVSAAPVVVAGGLLAAALGTYLAVLRRARR